MTDVLVVEGLKKSFGEVKAVNDLSFSVKEGSLFAFLGINGAGKSTTINIISTLLKKDEGKVHVAGHDLDADPDGIRRDIGVVFQGSVLDKTLTVKDNLSVRAAFYGLTGAEWKTRLDELTEMFELSEILKRPYGKLSGGQRRRVDVARGIMHAPRLLILDEPTTGLDPKTRKIVWKIVEDNRKQSGMTVLLTTHYMEEAAGADDVIIIDGGKTVAHGTPVELKDKYSGDYVFLYAPENDKIKAELNSYKYTYANNYYRISVDGSAGAKEFISKHGALCDDFEVVKGNMDDVFLNATGKSLSEADIHG